jgi:proton-translocating NADH-quinone oxidoreductase chain M
VLYNQKRIFYSVSFGIYSLGVLISFFLFLNGSGFGGRESFFLIDSVSLMFIMLVSIIFLACLIYLYFGVRFGFFLKNGILFFMFVLLIFAFIVNNLFIFFILFEALLFPMLWMIGLWGSRGRRVHALFQFVLFTLFSSLFLLLGIMYIYSKAGTLCFSDFADIELSLSEQSIIFFLFFFGFMAKVPTLPLHFWLPEAHVEAPTIGSVILAAILLKLGFFGMYRVLYELCCFDAFLFCRPICLTFLILSVLYCSAIAARQVDIKRIIAYSSVVHMNLGLFGFFGSASIGLYGTVVTMFSHGLVSAGLFFCAGMLYDRFHTKNIMYYGGIVQYMPIFSIIFFLFILGNIGFPGTHGFVGELCVFFSIYFSFGIFVLAITVLSMFGTTLFSFIVLGRVLFYQITGFLRGNFYDLRLWEFVILVWLLILTVFFGIFPGFFVLYF